MTFLQVGKLRLHKLCRNKHSSTAGAINPNSKRKTFSCFLSIILFNHKLSLSKYVLFFPYLWYFPDSPVILLSGYSYSFLAGDLQCCSFEINTLFLWHSLSAIVKSVFRHEIRRQMSVYFET